ncbi:oxidoreductase [Planctomycetota bacterium]|nr:oxidoreductase [Planctomycetota bacterium]
MIGSLSLTILGPLALALLCVLQPKPLAARFFALLGSAITLFVGAGALIDFAQHPGSDFRLVESHVWSTFFGAHFALGVDGISAAMLALSGLVTLIATIAAWDEQRSPRAYHALVLFLLAAMNGVFGTLDFLVFYVSWEVLLVPMLALIGVWGGEQRRYAALKFFVYTLAGSVLMLALLLALYNATPKGTDHTFDLRTLAQMWPVWRDSTLFGWPLARFGFFAVLIACLVKVPAVPVHTWLPHAHVQAPTAVSVLLAGVLLKLGVYGLYRIAWPLFPGEAIAFGPMIGVIGVIGILWGAWVALGQRDLKRLVAYSSVSHMGFCLLGLASLTVAGVTAGMVQAVTHGLSSSLLFLLVGVIYDRAHHRDVQGFGGLAKPMPRFTWILLLGALAGAGLPGLAGFIGEFLAFCGGFTAAAPFPLLTLFAVLSVVLSAAYMLWLLKRVSYGPLRHEEHANFPDCTPRELASLLPLCALLVMVGIWPGPLVDALRSSCEALLQHVQGARP